MSWKTRIDRWTKNLIERARTHGNPLNHSTANGVVADRNNVKHHKRSIRHSQLEALEARVLFNVDPVWVGGVYVCEDNGGDRHGDSFYITFHGGAANTQLTRLVIDTDQGVPGYSSGDNIFDTVLGGMGADNAFPYKLESLEAKSSNAKVSATVSDGGMQLILTFENFFAGDKVKFSIDVDELQRFKGGTDLNAINSNIDPITSGVEFADSNLIADFQAPGFEDANTSGLFVNMYDSVFASTGLDLPADNSNGFADRTAGAAASTVQIPKPIDLSGTVYADNNLNLTQDTGELGISGVSLTLYRLENGSYVNTGKSTTTDSQGHYQFGLDLGLPPGTYQIRETQPADYFSVGAIPGKLNGLTSLGSTVANDRDVLTDIQMPLGDSHATRLDFAEAQPVQISGFVYRDNNDNGRRDSGETGIGNVEVQIVSLDSIAGAVSQTALTQSDGSYRFVSLPPGRYRIIETKQPVGLLDGQDSPGTVSGQTRGVSSTNDQITDVRLNGNDNGIEFNFGELEPASLAGHVCVAMPGFDCFSTEPNSIAPLAGVKIDLVNASGVVVATTTTGTDGSYKFENLPAGVYNIVETQPANLLDGESRAGTIDGSSRGNAINGTHIEQISVGIGQNGIDYDFCELRPASIAGNVYEDSDGDCVRDPGEPELAGVVLELLDANGDVVDQTTTDALGNYEFSNLRPGVYSVREQQPAGYIQGGQMAGSVGGDDSVTDLISDIHLASGIDATHYDFCELLPASIAGNVYEDVNGDCLRSPDEPELAGVVLELLDAQGNVVDRTVTDSDGNYVFNNLKPGTYTVREEQPSGYIQGGQMAGSAGGNDLVTDIISEIQLNAGIQAIDYDFCEQRVASLEGMVFADLNEDCIFDSDESPIQNVRIELLDSNGNVVATTFTDAQGNYRFVDLKPGVYSVRETQPDGYFQGGQMAPPGVGNTDTLDLISQLALSSGQSLQQLDFCEVPPATISGYVFQDGPTLQTETGTPPPILKGLRDGIRNANDTPIAGVVLELRTRTGERLQSKNALPGTYATDTIKVVTDSNGYYEFRGLRPGAYHVYQTQPKGYYDGRDTAGTIGGFAINVDDIITDFEQQNVLEQLSIDPATNPGSDAILMINLTAGVRSEDNNFSEIVVAKLPPISTPPSNPPAPPPPALPPPVFKTPENGSISPPPERLLVIPPFMMGQPDIPLAGYSVDYTWHLSVIDAGEPRGHQVEKRISRDRVARSARVLNVSQWTIDTMDRGRWIVVSTNKNHDAKPSREAFDVLGAIQLAGDFNGDGRDELALFKDGEWLLDINGNGTWDQGDLWAKLGDKGDLPVVGDWDNDGKDDIGIYGPEWAGDDLALAAEPGLPDPENRMFSSPKNLPPPPVIDGQTRDRLMQRSITGEPRSDVIDHVFRFGGDTDQPVAGDFNGDGVSTLGIFNNGRWRIDVNGDGRFAQDEDSFFDFGQSGDIAVVGDFNGDGLDEIAVVRGRDLIVDSNGNGHLDATDRIFEITGEAGQVVVGDFDGDGIDEAAFYSSLPIKPDPEARTARR